MKKILISGLILIVIPYLLMLFFKISILVKTDIIKAGDNYFIGSWYGNLGPSEHPTIICKYFNGWQIVPTWDIYSRDNIDGKSSCDLFFIGYLVIN